MNEFEYFEQGRYVSVEIEVCCVREHRVSEVKHVLVIWGLCVQQNPQILVENCQLGKGHDDLGYFSVPVLDQRVKN